MGFKAKERGYEVTSVFYGVDLDKLEDYISIKSISLELLKKAGFQVLDSVEHKFSPQGYTFVALLAESHFAVHTYPEYGTIYFNLHSCGDKDEKIIFEGLKKEFVPKKVVNRKENVQIKI